MVVAKKIKKPKEQKIIVSGKRKTAIARAIVQKGTGKIKINKVPYELLNKIDKLIIEEPIQIAKKILGNFNFDIDIKIKGGGRESQIETARLVIARGILDFTKSAVLKRAFLDYDRNLLVADIRKKETYKPGDSKARKKRQKSYR